MDLHINHKVQMWDVFVITSKNSRPWRADLFTEVIIQSASAHSHGHSWTLTSEQRTQAREVQTAWRKPQTHGNVCAWKLIYPNEHVVHYLGSLDSFFWVETESSTSGLKKIN